MPGRASVDDCEHCGQSLGNSVRPSKRATDSEEHHEPLHRRIRAHRCRAEGRVPDLAVVSEKEATREKRWWPPSGLPPGTDRCSTTLANDHPGPARGRPPPGGWAGAVGVRLRGGRAEPTSAAAGGCGIPRSSGEYLCGYPKVPVIPTNPDPFAVVQQCPNRCGSSRVVCSQLWVAALRSSISTRR